MQMARGVWAHDAPRQQIPVHATAVHGALGSAAYGQLHVTMRVLEEAKRTLLGGHPESGSGVAHAPVAMLQQMPQGLGLAVHAASPAFWNVPAPQVGPVAT